MISVTRLGDILDFGQPFKAFGNKDIWRFLSGHTGSDSYFQDVETPTM